MSNKIYIDTNLEEYKKKYKNKKNLKKVSKVDFDKDKSLLKGKSWCLIDDTYYEIPTSKIVNAWSRLGKGGKISLCVLGSITLAAGVALPVTKIIIDNSNNKVVVTDIILDQNTIGFELNDIEPKKLKATIGPANVANKKIKWSIDNDDNVKLDKYETNSGEDVTITVRKKAEISRATITATSDEDPTKKASCVVSVNEAVYEKLEIANNPNKWIYVPGEKFSSEGLKVYGIRYGTKTDITAKCTLENIEEGHVFESSEIVDEKQIKVSFNGKETSFIIAINKPYSEYATLSDGYFQHIQTSPKPAVPKHLLIPKSINGTTVVGVRFFSRCDEVETVDCSQSEIVYINEDCFRFSPNLKKVIISPNLEHIGWSFANSFDSCGNLEEINFKNNGIIDYGNQINKNFSNCPKLKTITIDHTPMANIKGNEAQTAGWDPSLYSYLETIYVKSFINLNEDSYIYKNYTKSSVSDREGYDKYTVMEYNYSVIDENTCKITGAKKNFFKGGDVELPNEILGHKVVSIDASVMSNINKTSPITSFKYNDAMVTAGTKQFYQCSSLKKIHINSNLTNVGGSDDYSECTSLEEVVIDSPIVAADETIGSSGLFTNTTLAIIKIKQGLNTSEIIKQNFPKMTPASTTGDGYDHYEKN